MIWDSQEEKMQSSKGGVRSLSAQVEQQQHIWQGAGQTVSSTSAQRHLSVISGHFSQQEGKNNSVFIIQNAKGLLKSSGL